MSYPPTPVAAALPPGPSEAATNSDEEECETKSRRSYPFRFKVQLVRNYLKREEEGLSANAFVRSENAKPANKDEKLSRSVFLCWLKDVDIMVMACQEDVDIRELKKKPKASRKISERPPQEKPPKKPKLDGPVARKAYIWGFKVRFVRRYLEAKETSLAAGKILRRQEYLDKQDEDVDLYAFKRWISDPEIREALEANDDGNLADYVRKPRPDLIPNRVVEKPLEKWIEMMNGNLCKEGGALTIVEIRKKAVELGAKMIPGEKGKKFAASDPWIHRFFHTNGVVDHTLHGADIVSDKVALTALSNVYYYCKENKYDDLKSRAQALKNELTSLQKQSKTATAAEKARKDGSADDDAGEESVGAHGDRGSMGSI
jgi:hypothetical protein